VTTARHGGAGPDRLLVVAAVLELDSAFAIGAPTATFGGVPMSTLATTRLRVSREHAHLFYLRDALIPAGPR